MLNSTIKPTQNDVKTLVKDAQALFSSAAELTGEKADEIRHRGMHMLDVALIKAQDAKANVVAVGKDMAVSANDYVEKNPWRAVAAATSVGVLIGVLIARK